MKIVLIILAVIAGLLAAAFIFYKITTYKARRDYCRSHPYVLNSLTEEEKNWLADLYDRSLVSESGTFRGGGVWRREPSFYQKEIVGQIRSGRLDQTGLNTLQSMVFSLMEANKDNEQAKNLLNVMLMKVKDYTYSP